MKQKNNSINKSNLITALSLVSSCKCSLQCKYCLACKGSLGEKAIELQKNTIQAFNDGSYLKNTLTALKRLSVEPEDIRQLSFWGLEPTLTLEYFNNNIKDWFRYFPNIQTMVLSTNGMQGADILTHYVEAVDKVATKPIQMQVQFSYDGQIFTELFRGANPTKIAETLNTFILNLNNIKFNFVNVTIDVHSVLSFEGLHLLNSEEKIYNYYKELDDFISNAYNNCANEHIHVAQIPSINIEAPYNASSQDGIDYANFILHSLAIDNTGWLCSNSGKRFCGESCIDVILKDFKFDGQNTDLIKTLTDITNTKKIPNAIINRSYCGNNVTELKLLYDGTLVNCQAHLFDLFPDLLDVNESFEMDLKQSLLAHHYYINILTDPIEEVEKNFNKYYNYKYESFQFRFSQTLNLMYLLARSGQISRTYLTDHEKALRHCFLLCITTICAYNFLMSTGDILVRSTGVLRQYCNGALDIIDNFKAADLKYKITHQRNEYGFCE